MGTRGARSESTVNKQKGSSRADAEIDARERMEKQGDAGPGPGAETPPGSPTEAEGGTAAAWKRFTGGCGGKEAHRNSSRCTRPTKTGAETRKHETLVIAESATERAPTGGGSHSPAEKRNRATEAPIQSQRSGNRAKQRCGQQNPPGSQRRKCPLRRVVQWGNPQSKSERAACESGELRTHK
jgi:hypothetical protein